MDLLFPHDWIHTNCNHIELSSDYEDFPLMNADHIPGRGKRWLLNASAVYAEEMFRLATFYLSIEPHKVATTREYNSSHSEECRCQIS